MSNLKFTSTGSTTVTLSGNGLSNSFFANNSAYTLGTAISLADGETVEFYGTGTDFSKDANNFYQFSIGGTGTVTVEGDLVSLINNTAVKQYQFMKLFAGCDKITSIANLVFPATIADWCYANMFMDCTGLVNAGTTLPATAASRWCYQGMFARCSSMTTPPTINSTKLAPFCYYGMFTGCTSLVQGPELNNTVVEGQFSNNIMFKDCTSLSTITVSFTNWPAGNWSRQWLSGVAAEGVFVKPNTLVSIPEGAIPAGWTLSTYVPPSITVNTIPTFTFDAESETNIVSSLLEYAVYTGNYTLNCQIDGTLPTGLSAENGVITGVPSQFENDFNNNFNVVYSAQDVEQSVTSSVQVQIINATPDYLNMPLTFRGLSATNLIKLDTEGTPNVVDLQYSKNGGSWTSYTIKDVIELASGDTIAFSGNNNVFSKTINDVYTFKLSGTFEAEGNVQSLMNFSNSTSNYCYVKLFNGCSRLTKADNLLIPASTLAPSCYIAMFQGCSNMVYGPKELPALTVPDWCYQSMFTTCSNLISAPKIRATSISQFGFFYMFWNCSNLSEIEVDMTSWSSSSNAYTNWVQNVHSTGTFIKPTDLPQTTGDSRIPNGWTIVNK